MQLIKQQCQIIEPELAKLSLEQRIERCGRICYRSEDRITDDSALAFIERVQRLEHASVLEMARVSYMITNTLIFDLAEFVENPYFAVSSVGSRGTYIVSGSLRAWRDMAVFDMPAVWGAEDSVRALLHAFQRDHKNFCKGIDEIPDTVYGYAGDIEAADPNLANYEGTHVYVAVKLITSRGIANQLTRHRRMSVLQESQRYCNYATDRLGGQITYIKHAETILPEYLRSYAKAEKEYMDLIAKGESPQQARNVLPLATKTELIVYASLEQWRHIFALRTSSAADPQMVALMKECKEKMLQEYPRYTQYLQ